MCCLKKIPYKIFSSLYVYVYDVCVATDMLCVVYTESRDTVTLCLLIWKFNTGETNIIN